MNSNHRVIDKFNLQLFSDEEANQAESEEIEEVEEEFELFESDEVEEVEEQAGEPSEPVIEETKFDLGDVEVKFLHEVKKIKDIPAEELKTYVQKGMNHDRVLEKFTVANDKLEKVSQIASLWEMTPDQMLDTLLKNYAQTKADEEGESVSKVLERIEQNIKSTKAKAFERFVQKYPDVKSDAIPQEVWDSVNLGEDLTSAYGEYLKQSEIKTKENELTQLKNKIAELEGKLKTKEHNETVKKKAVVKSTSQNGVDDIKDDEFLQGLLG